MGKLEGKLKSGQNLEKMILELEEGEEAYTHPFFIEIDYDSNLYLNLKAPAKKIFDENYTVYIKKIGKNQDDYLVNIAGVHNYVWERQEFPFEKEMDELKKDSSILKIDYIPSKTEKEILEEQYQQAIQDEDYKLANELQKKIDKKNKK